MTEARIWDRLAGRYDTIVRLFHTSYWRVRERLAADIDAGGRVLEIAAGTGQFTLDLAGVADSLVATDVSPVMVERLRQRMSDTGLDGVECRVMSAYAIEPADARFDAVFCANALHVMDEPRRALAEFRRVLRADGVLVAPTFLHGVDGFRRVLSRSLSVVSPFVAHTRFDLGALKQTIVDAGFDVVHAETMSGLFPLGYVVARPATRCGQTVGRGPSDRTVHGPAKRP